VRRIDDRLASLSPPRVGPFAEGAFPSDLHRARVASWLGIALGVTFSVCFLTGMLSHLIQHPPTWFRWPPRPAGLYRLTQGIHVTTGIASIPLLVAKLWVAYPHLFSVPPVRSVAHALERISLVPLVGGSIFMLFSGIASISRWLPWDFSFPAAHYAVAWITIGALIVHVGAKIGVARLAVSTRSPDAGLEAAVEEADRGGLSRRGFFGAVAAASATLVAFTVGQTFRPLAPVAVLAPRDPRVGPQGLPVNKTAAVAGVTEAATDPDYRLEVTGNVREPRSFSLAELGAMSPRSATLPIACVDGWSANARWSGVAVRDLLAAVGAPAGARVRVASLQRASAPYSSSELDAVQAADPDTILALAIADEPLDIDHGYPVRLVGPNRPGVQQTKWVGRVEVL
jgi:DMSO/TMAO reductase YedYZ molybdopterin-dependent catalytic subunit